MITLKFRLADYRQQLEQLENERSRLENAIMGKNRQIDELLKRLEPGPEERACGDCLRHYRGLMGHIWCELFNINLKRVRDGAPQRCPQCLAAEVKVEVPNA